MAKLTRLSRSIAGRTAIVTGAGSGMGRATAHLFADEGAHVAVTDMNGSAAEAVAHEIVSSGGSAKSWELDVTNRQRVNEVIAAVVAAFGGLGIVVNNAGVSSFAPIDHAGHEKAWRFGLSVNLDGPLNVVQAALPHLSADGAGRIVNIASTEGVGATKYGSPYTASKHGLVGLTRSLAVELGTRGVTVNCVCPGPIHTGMTDAISDEHKAKFARRRVPLERYGDPEEVAHGTLSLVLPASSFINGATLLVDGGLTIRNA